LRQEKLLVNSMCGRLTRWLRMLGFDTYYDREADDDQLIAMAKKEGRILITRDVELHERASKAGLRTILLRSPHHAVQLATVISILRGELEIDPNLSRCPTCNSSLRRASRMEVEGKVPERSFKAHNEYWVCTGCGKIYWRGSHWRGISKVLEEARRLAPST